MGPVPAVRSALQKAGVELRDIDLFELNEAFAAQAVAVGRELAVPEDRLNVNGGAIAIGTSHRRQRDTPPRHAALRDGKRDVNLGVAALCMVAGRGSRWSWSEASHVARCATTAEVACWRIDSSEDTFIDTHPWPVLCAKEHDPRIRDHRLRHPADGALIG